MSIRQRAGETGRTNFSISIRMGWQCVIKRHMAPTSTTVLPSLRSCSNRGRNPKITFLCRQQQSQMAKEMREPIPGTRSLLPFPFPDPPADANIAVVNLKSEYKPFYIYQAGTTLGPYGWPPELRPDYSHFPVWDHWPVNQAPTNGRYQLFPDDFASAAVMSPDPTGWVDGPGPTKSSYFLFGLTRESAVDLALLDRSWLNPPTLKTAGSDLTAKFDPSQRAYVLEGSNAAKNSREKVDFTLEASDQSPAVNPAFVIKNWGDSPATVRIGGKRPADAVVRTGLVHRLEGTDLVIWVRAQSTDPIRLSISR